MFETIIYVIIYILSCAAGGGLIWWYGSVCHNIGIDIGRIQGYGFAKFPDSKYYCDVPESLEYVIDNGDYDVWWKGKMEGKFK